MLKSPTDRLKAVARSCGASHEDAKDIVQQATFLMYRHVNRGGVINDQAAFLKRVVANVAIDLRRGKVKKSDEVCLEAALITDPAPTPDEHYCAEQLIKKISQLLEGRGPNICRAFLLSRIYGESQREIARHLRVSVSAVEKYIAAAVAALTVERHQFE